MKKPRVVAMLTIGLVLLAALIAPTASAGVRAKPRVDIRTYKHPSWALWTDYLITGKCYVGPEDPSDVKEGTNGCIAFPLKPRDRLISVEVKDDLGRPVFGSVRRPGEGPFNSFCGETEKPFPHPGGEVLYVEVHATRITGDGECFPSIPTKGTVTVTFQP